ncbi:hypothetical protein PsorP6_018085 [Peronosclerospora sorghi]|uniref:Uncharacterized protein n=1 Tax=Peronosclerospora sorghi TaxID=230839 RepID=A0ACC0WDZ9_9STRA|nr:hypothetical protein PsorP6_018085 [Peronosclerospora sorghi]
MAEEEAFTASEPLALESSFTHWARCVEVPLRDSRVILTEQDPDSFVLGTTVWDSSKTLCKFIEARPERFRDFTSICELGAGCGGLAGIVSAIVTRGLADVVLSDIGPVLPWLRRNVRANLTDKELERVRVEQHAWGTPVTNLRGPFDCLLCADVVYEKAGVKPLVQSLLALSHRKTVIFLANERRAPAVRAEFMRFIELYFQWKEVPRAELNVDYLKEAIEVFEMKPKKRKVPLEMQIKTPDNFNPNDKEYHPLENRGGIDADPFDRDLWDDLLRDLSLDSSKVRD